MTTKSRDPTLRANGVMNYGMINRVGLDSADCRAAFCYQRRTAINQTAVYLYQCRAGVDFFGSVRAAQNATHPDDGQRATSTLLGTGL
jgi:hypothetical protein